MPTEGASNISELDSANPASNAPAGEGDDHIRMLKDVILASFEALDGLITNANGDGSAGNTNPPDAATFSRLFTTAFSAFDQKVPVGGIIFWSGLESEIPTGWFLCDGTNGTPDLRDKFILSSPYTGDRYVVGNSGGDAWGSVLGIDVVVGQASITPNVTVNGDTGTTNIEVEDASHIHTYLPPFYALAAIQYKGT